MAREYPRFLLSTPKGGKHKGPFVFHTIFPSLLCRIVLNKEEKYTSESYYKSVSGWTIELIETYDESANSFQISDAMDDMLAWLPSQF